MLELPTKPFPLTNSPSPTFTPITMGVFPKLRNTLNAKGVIAGYTEKVDSFEHRDVRFLLWFLARIFGVRMDATPYQVSITESRDDVTLLTQLYPNEPHGFPNVLS